MTQGNHKPTEILYKDAIIHLHWENFTFTVSSQKEVGEIEEIPIPMFLNYQIGNPVEPDYEARKKLNEVISLVNKLASGK
jgi:hypothetical protein